MTTLPASAWDKAGPTQASMPMILSALMRQIGKTMPACLLLSTTKAVLVMSALFLATSSMQRSLSTSLLLSSSLARRGSGSSSKTLAMITLEGLYHFAPHLVLSVHAHPLSPEQIDGTFLSLDLDTLPQ